MNTSMRRINSGSTLVLWCLASAISPAFSNASQHDLTADEILQRVAATYASCGTYHDFGLVKRVVTRGDGSHTSEEPFSITFVRPDDLRFEYGKQAYSGKTERHIVSRIGNAIYSWRDGGDVMEPKSLSKALSAVTVSGHAEAPLALLMPHEVHRPKLTDLEDAERLADTELEKIGCFVVRGRYGFFDLPVTVWVDRQTFLLRRVFSQRQDSHYGVETITTFAPVIDGQITEDMIRAFIPHQTDNESMGVPRPLPPSALRLDLERMTLNDIPLQEHLRAIRGQNTESPDILRQLMDGFDDAFSPLLGPHRRTHSISPGIYQSYPGTGIAVGSRVSGALSSDSADFTLELSVGLNAKSGRGDGTFRGVISGSLTANSSLDQLLELLGEPTRWCASCVGSRGIQCFGPQDLKKWDEPVSEDGAIRSFLKVYPGVCEPAYVSQVHYLGIHQYELDLEIDLDEHRTLTAIVVCGQMPDPLSLPKRQVAVENPMEDH